MDFLLGDKHSGNALFISNDLSSLISNHEQ